MFDGLTPPYRTIVADPPWPYEGGRDGKFVIPKPFKDQGTRGVEQTGYGLMSMASLRALPVCELAAGDAHLYLWTTNAFMVEAHELARAWGFKPKTILTWVKTRHDAPGRVSMKTGYYFRGATEHIVFAVRGSLRLAAREGWPTAYLWPRIDNHSVKPEAFYVLAETCSPGPYLDIFGRKKRLNWDVFGDQIHPQELLPLGPRELPGALKLQAMQLTDLLGEPT